MVGGGRGIAVALDMSLILRPMLGMSVVLRNLRYGVPAALVERGRVKQVRRTYTASRLMGL